MRRQGSADDCGPETFGAPIGIAREMMNLDASAMRDPSGAIPRHGIYRILICRPNHRLGNMVLMTPLIAELERLYKGSEIDIVAEGDAASDIFATFFSVKNVYCLPRRGFKHPVKFLLLIFRIRQMHYDLIIDPCMGSNFSRALTRIFKGCYKVGYGSSQRVAGLTHVVPESMAPQHMAKRPVSLVRWHSPLAQGEFLGFPGLDIRLTEAERVSGQEVVLGLLATLPPHKATCTVGIFADATGRKRYSREWWDDFIRAFNALAPYCDIIELIPMHGSSMLSAKWPSYYSSNLRRIGAVMAAVDLIISADCGVMHLAVASHVPTVGMFSVTDSNVYGPYGEDCRPLLTQGLSAPDIAERVVDAFPGLFAASAAIRNTARCSPDMREPRVDFGMPKSVPHH